MARRVNKRRKGFLAVLIPWARRFGLVLGIFLGGLWLGSWLYMSGAMGRAGDWAANKMLLASADLGFSVENVIVEGRVHTDPQVLKAILNIEKGDPLFAFNPKQATDLIREIGWTENVRVERRWPDTIYIGLKEREPLALWQQDQTMKLLDRHGEVIATDRLDPFADLVVVMGENAPKFTPDLLVDLNAEPVLSDRVAAAKHIGGRRWDLDLKNGVEVKLPEEDQELALRRLADAQKESGLLDKDILSVDLREADRISVKTKPGAVQNYSSSKPEDSLTKTEPAAGNNI